MGQYFTDVPTKKEGERLKERRKPSADAHEEPMSGGESLPIGPSWARAIRYRPSLFHRLSLTYSSYPRPNSPKNALGIAARMGIFGLEELFRENNFILLSLGFHLLELPTDTGRGAGA
jgi:hypothetical protein